MFGTWRTKLQAAADALRTGQLDEAGELLAGLDLEQSAESRDLTRQWAGEMVQRARQRSNHGDPLAGWRDLEAAEEMLGQTPELSHIRQQILDEALSEVEKCLRADDPGAALVGLDKLQRRNVSGSQIRTLRQVATRMQRGRRLARQGKFAEAEDELSAAAELVPDWEVIQRRRHLYQVQRQQCRQLVQRLHRGMSDQDWSEVAILGEALLEMAPEMPLAREAQKNAGSRAGTGGEVDPFSGRPAGARTSEDTSMPSSQLDLENEAPVEPFASQDLAETNEYSEEPRPVGEELLVTKKSPDTRLVLWIDAVGGFLVILRDRVRIGQAGPNTDVELPVLGDLSQEHAVITRSGEDYLLEPKGPVWLGEELIEEVRLLRDQDEFRLGSVVRFRFRRPHSLSASARLELVSRHRTQPATDGVLLMAESCVLGPRLHDHVVCHDWSSEVVLFRGGDGLNCRVNEEVEIDGKKCQGKAPLKFDSRVVGSDFAFSLEAF